MTLSNGAHKILRMTRDIVAKLVTAFRMNQSSLFKNSLPKRYADVFKQFELLPSQVKELLFTNEYTGEKLRVA